MTPFSTILDQAEGRAGGPAALAKRLPKVKGPRALKAVADRDYLATISFRVFSAGLRADMVRTKWPAFEQVFLDFEPKRLRAMNDEQLEALMADTRIIRHWGKIKATRANAAAMCDVAAESGGFGAYLAAWPGDRIVELWADLAKRFSQMGGNSGPYVLRRSGKDTFVLTPDVIAALNRAGAFKGNPKGKGDRAKVQAVFNAWAVETGLPLAHLSMICALSGP